MKLSKRMHTMATKKRFKAPAIWSILKDYSLEVAELEIANAELLEAVEAVAMLIENANKPATNYRLRMCVAAETALPYLSEVIRKHKGD